MTQVIVSDKADEDLIGIYRFLENRSPSAAANFFQSVDRRLSNLSAFPFIGRDRPDLGPGVRSLIVGNYLIFYKVEHDHIAIIRVIDGRRDIREEFRR